MKDRLRLQYPSLYWGMVTLEAPPECQSIHVPGKLVVQPGFACKAALILANHNSDGHHSMLNFVHKIIRWQLLRTSCMAAVRNLWPAVLDNSNSLPQAQTFLKYSVVYKGSRNT